MNATSYLHRRCTCADDAYSIEILGTEGRLFWKADRLEAAWYLPNAHFIPDGNNDAWEPLENDYIGGYTPSGDTHHEEQDYSCRPRHYPRAGLRAQQRIS